MRLFMVNEAQNPTPGITEINVLAATMAINTAALNNPSLNTMTKSLFTGRAGAREAKVVMSRIHF